MHHAQPDRWRLGCQRQVRARSAARRRRAGPGSARVPRAGCPAARWSRGRRLASRKRTPAAWTAPRRIARAGRTSSTSRMVCISRWRRLIGCPAVSRPISTTVASARSEIAGSTDRPMRTRSADPGAAAAPSAAIACSQRLAVVNCACVISGSMQRSIQSISNCGSPLQQRVFGGALMHLLARAPVRGAGAPAAAAPRRAACAAAVAGPRPAARGSG